MKVLLGTVGMVLSLGLLLAHFGGEVQANDRGRSLAHFGIAEPLNNGDVGLRDGMHGRSFRDDMRGECGGRIGWDYGGRLGGAPAEEDDGGVGCERGAGSFGARP